MSGATLVDGTQINKKLQIMDVEVEEHIKFTDKDVDHDHRGGR